MDRNTRDRIEARLQEERARATDVVRRISDATVAADDDGDLTRYPMHPADEGTDTMEQEKTLALLSQESDHLAVIDDALLRLSKDEESFGRCDNCGESIPLDRLELVPWTRLCLRCQAAREGTAE